VTTAFSSVRVIGAVVVAASEGAVVAGASVVVDAGAVVVVDAEASTGAAVVVVGGY
jgi:hypothetical protein